jgi:dipeptidyl aminopeptidase/acylaminoacyl peptidase
LLLFSSAALHGAQPWSVDDLWNWREVSDVRIRPDGSGVVWVESVSDRKTDLTCSTLWFASLEHREPQRLTEGACHESMPRWSADGRTLAFRSGQTPQIRVRGFSDAQSRPLPQLPAPPLSLAWSPDGTALAYTMLAPGEATEASWAPPDILPFLRARPPKAALFVAQVNGVAAVRIPIGNLEISGDPAWMPDGKSILISASEPGGDLEIYAVALNSGGVRPISHHAGADFSPLPSPDGSRIAWISRDAGPQSYATAKLSVANADGSRAKILAGALDRDVTHIQWSSDSRTVYFLADDRGASHIWSARADGNVRQVTAARERLFGFSLADNGRAVALRAAGEMITFPVDVRGEPAKLASPNGALLAARETHTPEEIQWTSAGHAIQGWVVKPPGRGSPLILDVQDSPRRMCGAEFNLRAQIFAARGSAVLCANTRGTPGFGEEFASVLRTRNPGDDFDDLMRGADYLAEQGLADPAKVHIMGGVLAAWAIGQTNRFRSAVAIDPVLFGGDPQRSPMFYADNFRTPALVIDTGMGPGASELYTALKSRRVDSAFVSFPAPRRPSHDVLQLETILNWLAR